MFQQQQNSFSCDTVPLIYVKGKGWHEEGEKHSKARHWVYLNI